jgi:hypothetical protein
MPVLCDFIQIVTDAEENIPVVLGPAEVALPDFNTGGREVNQTALLIYSAKNLADKAEVFINGNHVGTITATPAEGVFSTQLIGVRGSQLKDGDNEIVLRNVTDQFTIKDVNLFFHQSS